MIGGIDPDVAGQKPDIYPDEAPLLALRNMVIMPGIIVPVNIGRDVSKKLVKIAEKKHLIIGCACQKDAEVENPVLSDLYNNGTYAKVLKVIDLPFGNTAAILMGLDRMVVTEFVSTHPYITAKMRLSPELLPDKNDSEFHAGVDDLREAALEYVRMDDDVPSETSITLNGLTDDIGSLNFICANIIKSVRERQQLLETSVIKERMLGALRIVHREVELQKLKQNIRNKTQMDIAEEQKHYFLREQIKKMQAEMGEADRESQEKIDLREKAYKKKWSKEVQQAFTKELQKLDILNPQSPEYQIQLTYLQTLVALPWGETTPDSLNISRAEKVLNKNHYGMDKVKERILEFLAVLQLQHNKYLNSSSESDLPKTPIICLYGPPGVGKTSLGKSIADALKRKYVRMSLGGLHDESEIRGHRRTYIGAMPGRIIKNIQKAGTSNPVFVLDEIDKVVNGSVHGDPASALLEVLDPEQNKAFHDNYLDIDFDLSHVLFIATANDISGIPRPLLDRMELIEVSGYTTEEKTEIARRHLVKRELVNTGLDTENVTFTKKGLIKVIEQYTRESGVRLLEKQINKALRKLALERVRLGETPFSSIRPEEVEKLLGKPPYYRDVYQGNAYAGVVTGLAWTSVGGEILYIETSLSKGKGSRLTITGNLGDVMKESAMLALEYVKAHAEKLNIDYRIFDNWNIHIHVPEGATPKDGPSAGITIATSIASALTQRKVRRNVAMTGEITLRGKVLPVGGIKEKILAAKRAGITDIMLCRDNRKDIEEIEESYLTGVTFHYVENVLDVWDFALTGEIVDNPVCFDIKDDNEEKK